MAVETTAAKPLMPMQLNKYADVCLLCWCWDGCRILNVIPETSGPQGKEISRPNTLALVSLMHSLMLILPKQLNKKNRTTIYFDVGETVNYNVKLKIRVSTFRTVIVKQNSNELLWCVLMLIFRAPIKLGWFDYIVNWCWSSCVSWLFI